MTDIYTLLKAQKATEFRINHHTLLNAGQVELPGRSALICVEGNIGCSKSTFLNHINHSRFVTVPEPLELWQHDSQNRNLLQLYYQYPYTYGFEFQRLAIRSVHDGLERTAANNFAGSVVVTERSVYSSWKVFTQCMLQRNYLTPLQGETICNFATACRRPNLYIYLYTTPDVAYERTIARGRAEEAKLTPDYFEELHSLHNTWLLEEEITVPVLVVDANGETQDLYDNIVSLLYTALS